jgi:hypothetical protein
MKFADYLLVLRQHTVAQMSGKAGLINTCQRTHKIFTQLTYILDLSLKNEFVQEIKSYGKWLYKSINFYFGTK